MESGDKLITIQVPKEMFLKLLIATEIGLSLIFVELCSLNEEDPETISDEEKITRMKTICLAVEYILKHGYSLCVDSNNKVHYTVVTKKDEDSKFIEQILEEKILECDENILATAKKLVIPISTILSTLRIEANNNEIELSDN